MSLSWKLNNLLDLYLKLLLKCNRFYGVSANPHPQLHLANYFDFWHPFSITAGWHGHFGHTAKLFTIANINYSSLVWFNIWSCPHPTCYQHQFVLDPPPPHTHTNTCGYNYSCWHFFLLFLCIWSLSPTPITPPSVDRKIFFFLYWTLSTDVDVLCNVM